MQEQDKTDEFAWPGDLDAMVAAPDHHLPLLENDRVRVLESVIRPGEATPVHTHRWSAALYILGTSHFVRKDSSGNILFDSRSECVIPQVGTALWSAPLEPHFVENVGDHEIRVISVELKD